MSVLSTVSSTVFLLLFSLGSAAAYTPAYQGFDASYVTLGQYNGKTQAITIIVDDSPFHFKLEAELDADEATENIALSMDELEFAVGYTGEPLRIKGAEYYFEIADLVVLWENEPVKVKNIKTQILPPYNKSKKANAMAVVNTDAIQAYNKKSGNQKYTEYESLIDDAVTSAWNKDSRQSSKSFRSPTPVVGVSSVTTSSKQDELKRKLDAAKAANAANAVNTSHSTKTNNTSVPNAYITPPVAAAGGSYASASAYPKVQGGPIVSSDYMIEDSSTRRIIGFTLLATSIITGLQAIMEHQVQASHAANVRSYEELYNLSFDPSQINYTADPHFMRMFENEKAIKSKHETNRNLASIVSILSFTSGIIVLNF